jgi:hypothetical protein
MQLINLHACQTAYWISFCLSRTLAWVMQKPLPTQGGIPICKLLRDEWVIKTPIVILDGTGEHFGRLDQSRSGRPCI